MRHVNLSRIALALALASAAFSQTYTATPITTPFDVAGLAWISDDGRGFGAGYQLPPALFVEQCFSYLDGAVSILPTPGYSCQVAAATDGIAVLQLNVPGDFVNFKLGVYSNGNLKLLNPPEAQSFSASFRIAVNHHGQMAGTFLCPSGSDWINCAYSISPDGTFTRLPNLGSDSGATAINDNGDIAGYVVPPGSSGDSLSTRQAVVWTSSGTLKNLSSMAPFKLGTPAAINSRGQVAGRSPFTFSASGTTGPGFFYDGSNFTPILPQGASSISVQSMNDQGEIIGSYATPNVLAANTSYFDYLNGVSRDLNSSLASLPATLYVTSATYITNSGRILVTALSVNASAATASTSGQQFLLTPTNAPATPVIGAVVNAYSHAPGIASAAWIQIVGQNLSSTTRTWTAADFNGTRLPTSLDGVSVTINGLPAYLEYVSSKQLIVLAPDDLSLGYVQVVVSNSLGTSSPFSILKNALVPALLTYNSAPAIQAQPLPGLLAALHPDGTPVCSSVTDTSFCKGRGAQAGETISLFGTGFGATTPPTSASDVVSAPAALASPVSVTVGGQPAQVTFAGRVASGLDQINIVVPASVQNGASAVSVTINGVVTLPANLWIGPN